MSGHTNAPPPAISPWIARFLPDLPSTGHGLDLACGSGRHLRALIAAGWHMTGIDRDISGLQDLAGQRQVDAIQADLEDGSPFPLAGRHFDLVIVTNYLHRPLLPLLPDLLAPGGWLLYETFMVGQERYGRPTSPDFLLQPDELLHRTLGRLTIRAFEQGDVIHPQPRCVQRLAALAR